jgi:hypothetical protein
MSCTEIVDGGVDSSGTIPQNVSRITVKIKMAELVLSNPEFRNKVRELQKTIANEPTQEALAQMSDVEKRTYRDTRHLLEVQIVGALGLNPVTPIYRNYLAQVDAGTVALDYVRKRTLDDAAHSYDVENVKRVIEMLRAVELGDLSQSEVKVKIKEPAKDDSSFAGNVPEKSSADQIILNLYKEVSGLVGRQVNIDFKDRASLREVRILKFEAEPITLQNGMRKDLLFITYLQNGVEQKLFPGDVAAIINVGVKVTPGKRASSYEHDTRKWTEYNIGKAFAVPELPDGTWLPSNEVIGQTVSLLTFPLLSGQRRETHSRVVTGKLVGWPIYHGPQNQGDRNYTILTSDGKEIKVDMDTIRRFRVKPSSTGSSNSPEL